MRAVLIAPFVLSTRVELAAFLLSDPRAVRRAVRAVGLPGWDLLGEESVTSAALIHDHEPLGATLAPRRLVSARALPGERPESALPGVTEAELSVGVHGTGCLVLWFEGSMTRLTAVEEAACSLVPALAADVSALIARAGGTVAERSAGGRYPLNDFLWWHRVLHPVSSRDAAVAQALLVGARRATMAAGVELAVGDGWTVLTGGDDADLASSARGIIDAQEIWTTSETASREIVMQLAAVQAGTDDPAELRSTQLRAAQVAESEQLRAAVLQDQVRYTTGVRREALDTAAEAWDMSLVLAPVASHLSSLQAMLSRRIEAQREKQARRIEAAVFALGILTAFGLLLGVFETAVGPEEQFHLGRLLTAILVALAGTTSAALGWRAFRRHLG